MRSLLVTISLGLAMAAPASAYRAINGLTVLPAGQSGQFEVISSLGAGPQQMWCAAAKYARHGLHVAPNSRIFIANVLSPSASVQGRKSVIFTVSPNAEQSNGPRPGEDGNYSVSLKKPGFNLSLAHAESFCLEELIDLLDR